MMLAQSSIFIVFTTYNELIGVNGMELIRAFTVRGNIEKVFDLSENYISRTKFKIVKSIRPRQLILKRGNTLGSLVSYKIENYKTTLTISFIQSGDDVNVSCNYEIKTYVLITPTDKSKFGSEVERFNKYLQTKQ